MNSESDPLPNAQYSVAPVDDQIIRAGIARVAHAEAVYGVLHDISGALDALAKRTVSVSHDAAVHIVSAAAELRKAQEALIEELDSIPGVMRRYHKDGSHCWVGSTCKRAHDIRGDR